MSRQKEYLEKLEKQMKVKTEIFIDRNPTQWKKENPDVKIWMISEDELVHASQIQKANIVGRYRIDRSNSDGIYELWFELDASKDLQSKDAVNKQWKYMASTGEKLLTALENFGIHQDYVIIKSSGRGLHFHVYVEGIASESQYKQILLAIMQGSGITSNINQSKAKDIAWGFDGPAIISSRRKVRAFGAENIKLQNIVHFCSVVPDLKGKNYPFIKKADDVIYPNEMKIFKIDKSFIRKLSEYQNVSLVSDTIDTSTVKINYERSGNLELLEGCPAIKEIIEKSNKGEHILNSERLLLLQTYGFYGENGLKKIHEILSKDKEDYSEAYTNHQIENMMKQNRKPITCRWVDNNIVCPKSCGGISSKTPATLAWTPPDLEKIHNLVKDHLKVRINGKLDWMICDIVLGMAISRSFWPEIDPLWLFVLAPSGGGKTEHFRMVKLCKKVYTIDTLTSKSLVSGYKADEKKYGIAAEIDGKVVFVKDMSNMLTESKEERNATFGMLRNAYDGELEKGYGTKEGKSSAKCSFDLMVGITPIIDSYFMFLSQLGERFLKVRFRVQGREILESILLGDPKVFTERRKKLQRMIKEFIESLDPQQVEFPVEEYPLLMDMIELCTKCRTSLWVKGEGDRRCYTGQEEVPSRIGFQVKKLWNVVCNVRGKTKVEEEELALIARVLLQTPPLDRMLLIYYLAKHKIANTPDLAAFIKSSQYNTEQILDELSQLDVMGHNMDGTWCLTMRISLLMETLEKRGWLDYIIVTRKDFLEVKNQKNIILKSGKVLDKAQLGLSSGKHIDRDWLNK